jgi:cysteine desulfurase
MSIYLDNNATTPLAPEVIEAMYDVLLNHYGNPASNTHPQGWYAQELVQIAREHVAKLIGAKPDEIVFTSGATESNNLAIKGAAYALGVSDANILSCQSEHRSVLDPLIELEQQGATVKLLAVDDKGEIKGLDHTAPKGDKFSLVSLMLANNEIGTIHPIEQLKARYPATMFHSDATQALGKLAIDVDNLGVDLLSLSAHKAYGPKGVGALYIRKKNPRLAVAPLIHGGGHEEGMRSGTLNVAGIVGFGEACRIAHERIASEPMRLKKLTETLLNELQRKISGIWLNGPNTNRLPGNLNIAIDNVSATRLIGKVNTKLAISSSSACSSSSSKPSHVLASLGLPRSRQINSIRLGVGRYTTEEELHIAVEILAKAITDLRN